MKRVAIEHGFAQWREEARRALAEGFRPEEIHFADALAAEASPLLLMETAEPSGARIASPHVPAAFLELAEQASAHSDAARWELLYRLLYRLQQEHGLLRVEVDDDVAAMHRLVRQVNHDVHKMHAFVRFRRTEIAPEDGSAQEHFIAYYKPAHHILRLAAPFFAERFAVMRWSILTAEECAHWDPEAKQLRFTPGVAADAAPDEDALEDLWKSYYSSIFNPARLNETAMRSEMPVRYWKHLPEIALLPGLMQRAEGRVATMVETQTKQPTAAPFVPAKHTLPVLREAMPGCRGCDLYKHATQVVPGAGSSRARLLIVGEQPGDQEDLQGKPFVGPAGSVLRKAMEELGISTKEVFVTNAVKHFKFVERGKQRLHQSPRMSEISACRPWLEAEMDAVKPAVVLCMGASAAKSLLGGTFRLMASHGKPQSSKYAGVVYATIHPSAVLRAPDEDARHEMYETMKRDMLTAYRASLEKE